MLEPEPSIRLSHASFIFTLNTGCLASLCLGLCLLTLKIVFLLIVFLLIAAVTQVYDVLAASACIWRSESLRFCFTLANGLEVVQFAAVATFLAIGRAACLVPLICV